MKLLYTIGLILILSLLHTMNASGYEAQQVSKSEIDSISCDINFDGTMRHGFSYSFSDVFTNPGNTDILIKEVAVNYNEQSDINNSSTQLLFSYTDWIVGKDFILNPGDNDTLIIQDNGYKIITPPEERSNDNFIIKYTAEYFYKDSMGDFSNGPHFHTECKKYDISWCGDSIVDTDDGEVCDPNDVSKKNWGENGCAANACTPIGALQEPPVEEESLNPSCKGISAVKTVGTGAFSTQVSCRGDDVSIFTIDCGNGNSHKYQGKKDGIENITHTCDYTSQSSQSFTASCKIDDLDIVTSCQQDITIDVPETQQNIETPPVVVVEEEDVVIPDPIIEELTPPTPECQSIHVDKKTGTEQLSTPVQCQGQNISNTTLDCGNGTTFQLNGNGQTSVNGTCSYAKPGNYTISCKMAGATKSCSDTVTVVAEDMTAWENKMKEIFQYYQELENKLEVIVKEETASGQGSITLPEILPKTGTPIQNRVEIRSNPQLDTQIINERFTLAGSSQIDISYWIAVLPEQDRNAQKYIVTPSNGMVLPINNIPEGTTDYSTLVSGREIKVNTYLKTGAMEYAGTSIKGYGEVGNKVVFAHSSYWKHDDGRYKTDFQKIIELDEGEEVWIYEKQESGTYKRYRYSTVQSYNTDDSDTKILLPGTGKNLTLFTCTPIGGIDGRWVIKGKYIDENKEKLKNQVHFGSLQRKYKIAVINIITKIQKLPQEKQKQTILQVYKKVESIKPKLTTNTHKEILTYLQYKLAEAYFQ